MSNNSLELQFFECMNLKDRHFLEDLQNLTMLTLKLNTFFIPLISTKSLWGKYFRFASSTDDDGAL